jgi:hypothetical protein
MEFFVCTNFAPFGASSTEVFLFLDFEEDAKVRGHPHEDTEDVWSVYFCACNIYLSSGAERDPEVTF